MKNLFYLFVGSLLLIACNKADNNHNGNDLSSKNAARMQEFYDQVMNAHNTAMVDSFCTSDFKDHQADPRYPAGVPGLKATMADYFAAFPDLHVKTNFTKAWGDTVMSHITMTGTQSGPMMGMPASNKQMNIDGIDIVIIKDGKATEHWGYQEESKMMMQLGMMGGGMADSSMKK